MRGSDSAPVAQLDRVLGYEPRGRAFESLRAHQQNQAIKPISGLAFLFSAGRKWDLVSRIAFRTALLEIERKCDRTELCARFEPGLLLTYHGLAMKIAPFI
jgi:hypothetical protein